MAGQIALQDKMGRPLGPGRNIKGRRGLTRPMAPPHDCGPRYAQTWAAASAPRPNSFWLAWALAAG